MTIIGLDANPFKTTIETLPGMAAKAGQRSADGLKAIAGELERQIDLAKEAGKSYDDLALKLSLVEKQIGKVEEANRRASMASDLERYLQSPSQSQGSANTRGDDSDLLSKNAALKEQLKLIADRTTAQERSADKEILADSTLSSKTKDYIERLDQTEGAVKKVGRAHGGSAGAMREFSVILRELARGDLAAAGRSFTLLIQQLGLARLLFNPVTAIIAGIAGAFMIWKFRVDALAKSLTGLQVPELSPPDISKLSAAEQGWKKISDAIKDATKNYNSVSESADRHLKTLKDQHASEKQLLEVLKQKALEGARTEWQKDSIKSDFQNRRKAMDDRQIGELLAEMNNRKGNLEASARTKKEQADAIKVATPEKDSQMRQDLKAQAESAKEQLKEFKERLDFVQKARGAAGGNELERTGSALIREPQWLARYGSMNGGDAEKLERAKVEAAQAVIKKYEDFEKKTPERDISRANRDKLYEQAAKEAAEAATIGLAAGDQKKEMQTAAERERIQEKLKDIDAEPKGHQTETTALQKIGAYAAVNVDPAQAARERQTSLLTKLAELSTSQKDILGQIHQDMKGGGGTQF
jgi:hypothetical protein